MPRIELTFPEAALFVTELPVRVSDLNYANHLGNDAVLAIAQEARMRLLAQQGFASELDVGGVGLIMADAAVVYRGEGSYGMVLRVELALDDVKTRGFDLLYRMTDARSGREIALVKTGMLWFDYRARRIVRMPEAFRKVAGSAAPAE